MPEVTPADAPPQDAFAGCVPCAAAPTRKRYETSFTALERVGVLKAGATVNDLATVDWTALHATWPGGPSDWNHLRRAVSHFLTMQLGDVHHAFRRAVVKAIPRAKEVERVPDLPPTLFWKIVNAAPTHAQACFVTIAALGLRVGEYLRLTRDHLLPHSFAVQIPGTKTAGSARRRAWTSACGRGCSKECRARSTTSGCGSTGSGRSRSRAPLRICACTTCGIAMVSGSPTRAHRRRGFRRACATRRRR